MGLDDLGEGKWASTSFEIGSLSKIAKATCRDLVWNKDEFCFSSLAFGSPFSPPPLSFFFFFQHEKEKKSSQVYKHFFSITVVNIWILLLHEVVRWELYGFCEL